MAKKVAKKKVVKKTIKKAAPKKAVKKAPKKVAKKTAKKAVAPAPLRILTDSNGDPIGGQVLAQEVEAPQEASKGPKGTEIDSSKGAVSIRAKKTSAEASSEKKGFSVVMRGGVPTKVEDNGDDI